MAGLAGNFTAVAAVVQGKSMFPQGGRAPALVRVAIIAARAEEPGMDGRFLVASNTLRRCTAKLIVLVAVRALQVGMLSVKGKYHLVIKTMQAVHPIMANQAVCTVLLNVLIHKSGIVVAVAVLAGLGVKRQLLSGVTGGAQHGRLAVIHGMPVEGKLGETVVKSDVINFGRAPIKGGVAGRAVGTEHPRVTFWLFMAGCTVCFCRGEGICAVALLTFQCAVFTCQWKTG